MHKSVITISSLFFLVILVMLVPFANTTNFFPNAMAQGNEYDGKSYNNKYYDDRKISLYPTKVNKYECQKGPFEGFFVSSLKFCKDVSIVNVNGIGTQPPQSPPAGPQVIQIATGGLQEATGPHSPNQINVPSVYYRNGNLATTDTTSQIASVAFCDPGDIVLEGSYQLSNKQGNPILGFINSILEDKNAYTTALISTNVTLQSAALCSNNNP